jgi:superfamily I DNA/RNA helicase
MPNWTGEQNEIFEVAKTTNLNLLIEALAGAAKTTTLVELARYLSGNTLCLAFNSKISKEMEHRMPQGIECRTLNSLGHRVLGQYLQRRLSLFNGKLHQLLVEEIETGNPAEKEYLYENLGDLHKVLSASKNSGHVPDSIAADLGGKCNALLSDAEFFDLVPEELSDAEADICLRVLRRSFRDALDCKIDYADQLLLPTVLRMPFPMYANVMVDEAQDLSEANHVMLGKVAKRRLIAVGDSLQAIYAFRGAHANGMPLLRERFNMETRYLSTTFRCPSAVCEHVRHHAHRIQVWEGNLNNPGSVTYSKVWSMEDIPDGAAVLCRNNAPLFRFALRLLKVGRRPNLWGRDVGAFLIKILEKLGAPNMTKADALLALRKYATEQEARLKKESAKAALADRIDCLFVFVEAAQTLGGAIVLAKDTFNSSGKVDLATGHKAKGAEWKDVFILDPQLIGDEGQELNLAYVLATRAQNKLTYIQTDGYAG